MPGSGKKNTGKEKSITAAHQQADKDIDQDRDLSAEPNPEDDLDEGELARLEGEGWKARH